MVVWLPHRSYSLTALARICLVFDFEKLIFFISLEHKSTYKRPDSYSLPTIAVKTTQENLATLAIMTTPTREPIHLRGSARIYVVRDGAICSKITKLSHIICAHRSQYLRSRPRLWLLAIHNTCVTRHHFFRTLGLWQITPLYRAYACSSGKIYIAFDRGGSIYFCDNCPVHHI